MKLCVYVISKFGTHDYVLKGLPYLFQCRGYQDIADHADQHDIKYTGIVLLVLSFAKKVHHVAGAYAKNTETNAAPHFLFAVIVSSLVT